MSPPDDEVPGSGRHAAVAIVVDDARDILFIRRAERTGDPWSGHIAFPGGGREDVDADLLDTALRETWEEVGLRLDRTHCVGRLRDVTTIRGLPDRVVRPFVFRVHAWPAAEPGPEVARCLRWPLEALASGEGRATFPYVWRGHPVTLPCVDRDGERLWGMTLGMVDDLIARLRSP